MNPSSDMTLAVVKMVASLGLVLALLWALQRWIVRCRVGNGGPEQRKYIRIVDSHYLGAKKSIAVVQVSGSLLVVGLGATEINLLARIDQFTDRVTGQSNDQADDQMHSISNWRSGAKHSGFIARFKELVGRQ